LAVVVIYFQYILKHPKIIHKILYSFVPTAVAGLIFYKIIKTIFFESNSLIIDAIFLIGLVFVILEYLVQKKKIKLVRSVLHLSNLDAIKIGFAQALAVVPGVSRSGIVMVAMMFMGFKREDAALYSFLIAVPTILAASAYDLFKMRTIVFSSLQNFPLLLVGFVMSFITAYIVVNWFIGFLKKNSLIYFGIYRIALAIILMFIF
ncbi:undecaprenyl-diphosphatase, partial [Candidatus Roizmanbacteria bacterium CG_4_10_14_0_8_um_filter_39_9]